jgi:phosphoribosyl-dephospho-CoA transferase
MGRAILPFAKPAITKMTANMMKKAAIAVNREVNLGRLLAMNSLILPS